MNITKEKLLKAEPMFMNVFHNIEDVFSEFDLPKESQAAVKIIFADYTNENYSGHAYVLGYNYNRDTFFEVHGEICSFYGLEKQWDEEDCTIEELNALFLRRKKDKWYAFCEFIEKLEK